MKPMAKTKYFVFDEELWQEGYFYHCETKGDSLTASTGTEREKGVTSKAIYLSAPLDSEEKETVWGRLRLQLHLEGDSAVKVSYFASDQEEIVFDGKKIRIMDLIADESMEMLERLILLEPLWVEERKNPTDIFLYRAKGRFLYLCA